MRLEILGVPIDAVTETEALAKAEEFLASGRGHLVTTPNPEMIVLAARDQRFRQVMRTADLAIPDGVGLVWAARRQGQRLTRLTGVDFAERLVRLAAETGRTIYLLGAGEGVAAAAAAKLKGVHPNLKVVGAASGGQVECDASGQPHIAAAELEAIRAAAPDILFVAFGHGRQEEWIAANLPKLLSVRIAAGIGGTFDFWAGRARRAPSWMRKTGLEWLWRLIREPRRWRRIWNAVVVFPCLVFRG